MFKPSIIEEFGDASDVVTTVASLVPVAQNIFGKQASAVSPIQVNVDLPAAPQPPPPVPFNWTPLILIVGAGAIGLTLLTMKKR